jgi:hypothetical protein
MYVLDASMKDLALLYYLFSSSSVLRMCCIWYLYLLLSDTSLVLPDDDY